MSGKFNVKSAYKLANGWIEENVWEGWRMIWKMKLQQPVKVFVWILAHEKLMTNSKRWKRRLTHSPYVQDAAKVRKELCMLLETVLMRGRFRFV